MSGITKTSRPTCCCCERPIDGDCPTLCDKCASHQVLRDAFDEGQVRLAATKAEGR